MSKNYPTTIGLLKQLNTRLFKVILIIPLAYWCIKTSELYKYWNDNLGKSPMFGGSQDHDGNNYINVVNSFSTIFPSYLALFQKDCVEN